MAIQMTRTLIPQTLAGAAQVALAAAVPAEVVAWTLAAL